jgi:hypothetical protein
MRPGAGQACVAGALRPLMFWARPVSILRNRREPTGAAEVNLPDSGSITTQLANCWVVFAKTILYHLLHRRAPQHFIAFDLIWLRGRDLRSLPLIERKRALAQFLRAASARGTIRLSIVRPYR